jgi:hypothetical protein
MDKTDVETTALDLLAKMYEAIPKECQPLPRGVLQSKNALANLIRGVAQEELPHETEARKVGIGDTVYYLGSRSVQIGVVWRVLTIEDYPVSGNPMTGSVKYSETPETQRSFFVVPQSAIALIGEYNTADEFFVRLTSHQIFATKQELLDSL